MSLFLSEFEQLQNGLSGWTGESALIVHIYGRSGSGKQFLVQQALQHPLKQFRPLWHFDFNFFSLNSREQFIETVRHITQEFAPEFQSYLTQFPSRLGASLAHLVDSAVSQTTQELWENHFLHDFLSYLCRDKRGVIVLNQLFEKKNRISADNYRFIERLQQLPLLIISTGDVPLEQNSSDAQVVQIPLNQRSVREAERLIATQLNTDAMSTRLITNHLFVKSSGNLHKICLMLEAYYRPLLQRGTKKFRIDNEQLQRTRVSSDFIDIFQHLLSQFSTDEQACLGFLSHLKDPLPQDVWFSLLRVAGAGKRAHKMWLQSRIVFETEHCGEKYVVVGWEPWREFLQKNVPIYLLQPIMSFLSRSLARRELAHPLELSGLFSETGDFETAIKMSLREAKALADNGETMRALDRYAFLRRNVTQFPKTRVPLTAILHDMGELQMQLGLFENAFESFRELRDRLKNDQKDAWMQASLQMANALFQMDLHSEAHYLIKDLKYRKDVPVYVHAFSHVLNGELEQNFGRPEYALKSYDSARALLGETRDEKIILQLYQILKERYQSLDAGESYLQLLQDVCAALPERSPSVTSLQLEVIRQLIRQQHYDEALPLAIRLLRRNYLTLTPKMIAQLRLYLSEIYGFYGKWYLSRSQLLRLTSVPLLTPSKRIEAQVFTNLGIIEKELNKFGAAIDYLQDALSFCKAQQLTRQGYLIKIHLGHIYLLTHSYIRGYDHLIETLRWAEEQRDDELVFSALLFLSSYNMQQQHLETAGRYLEKAGEIIHRDSSLLDKLNYNYYKTLYLIKTGELVSAEKQVHKWLKQADGIIKFENLARVLLGRIYAMNGDFSKAKQHLIMALEIQKRYRQPAVELQILRELGNIFRSERDESSAAHYFEQAYIVFQQLLNNVGDEIMRKQMEESREYESLLKYQANR